MTVAELIEKLKEMPQEAEVKLECPLCFAVDAQIVIYDIRPDAKLVGTVSIQPNSHA